MLCLLLSTILGVTYVFSCCETPPIWPSFRQWASSALTVICPGIQPHLSTCTPKVFFIVIGPLSPYSFTLNNHNNFQFFPFSLVVQPLSWTIQHGFICRPCHSSCIRRCWDFNPGLLQILKPLGSQVFSSCCSPFSYLPTVVENVNVKCVYSTVSIVYMTFLLSLSLVSSSFFVHILCISPPLPPSPPPFPSHPVEA